MSREWTDIDGTVYEVVWDGSSGKPLTGDRASKPNELWDAPDAGKLSNPNRRIYNKTGNHTKNKDFWTKREFPLGTEPGEKAGGS